MIKNGDQVIYNGQQCKVICAMKGKTAMLPIVLIPGGSGEPGRAIQVKESELRLVSPASSAETQEAE